MTTREVLASLAELGINVDVNARGVPVLRLPPQPLDEAVRAIVLRVVKHHREAILAGMPKVRLYEPDGPEESVKEVLFRTGRVERHHFPEQGFPVGAWWFREAGGPWQPIPGTPGEQWKPTEPTAPREKQATQ